MMAEAVTELQIVDAQNSGLKRAKILYLFFILYLVVGVSFFFFWHDFGLSPDACFFLS